MFLQKTDIKVPSGLNEFIIKICKISIMIAKFFLPQGIALRD